jgi:hypothetical protein
MGRMEWESCNDEVGEIGKDITTLYEGTPHVIFDPTPPASPTILRIHPETRSQRKAGALNDICTHFRNLL